MIRLFVFLITLLFTTQALAKLLPIQGGIFPPKRYDYPFKGKVIVHHVELEDGVYGFVWGGIAQESGICTIYVRRGLTGIDLRQIIRHEIGHCNGWPGNHPR